MSEQSSLFGPIAEPFVKWPGGKRQLLGRLLPRAPVSFTRYHEPFLGGGALFFGLRPQSAVLSDINGELINAYQVVRDDPAGLVQGLRTHRFEATHYYRVRALQPSELDRVQRAARLIFLNKACYNGIYRVNAKGRFNVPFGKHKNPTICDVDGLRRASAALAGHVVKTAPFETVLDDATTGAFVYFDPPYLPLSATASFTAYTSTKFTLSDQQRLAASFRELDKRGVYVMASNADVEKLSRLYAGFHIERVAAKRSVNCNAQGRGAINELLITNY